MNRCSECETKLTDEQAKSGRCPHCKSSLPAGNPRGLDARDTVDGTQESMDSAATLTDDIGSTCDFGPDVTAVIDSAVSAPHNETVDLASVAEETFDMSVDQIEQVGQVEQSGQAEAKQAEAKQAEAKQAEAKQADPAKQAGQAEQNAGSPPDADDAGTKGTIDLPSELKTQVSATHESGEQSQPAADRLDATLQVTSETKAGWSKAVGNATAQMTIKQSSEMHTNPNSSLVIQPRALLPADDEDTTVAADYNLVSLLGEGGMGVVYDARQSSIDRSVAVKMLKSESVDEVQQQKFLAEAVVTGELDHPNIVPIYDLGRNSDGALFYSMKKVEGRPWMDSLPRNSLDENLQILLQVADAVAFAHSRGVVHRDLKPENVMLGEFGEVLVLDWGLAMATADCTKADTVNSSTGMGGTPAYMAPEMVLGPVDEIGPHSDVYLLGAILYEIITGHAPHTGSSALNCIMAAGRNEIQTTEKSGELVEIALRAMSTDPQDRYESVQALQTAIRSYQSHSESVALSARATDDLAEARKTDEYSDYARALYVFEEAFELWDGNLQAKEGVASARQAYAESAFRKGDFELGLSFLDVDNPAHERLWKQLTKAQEERRTRQKRVKNLKRIVIALAALVFVAVTVGMLSFRHQKAIAEENEQEAKRQEKIATANAIEKERQRGIAEETAKEEERQRNIAEQNAIIAQENERKAAYEAYLANIGLAETRINDNALAEAREILSGLVNESAGWEVKRLWYLCNLSRELYQGEAQLEAVALDAAGQHIAVGGESGILRIIQLNSGEVLHQKQLEGGAIHAIAFSPTDPTLIAVGCEKASANLQLWNFQSGERRQLVGHGEDNNGESNGHPRVVDVRFSRDGRRLLTASHDHTGRLWDIESATQIVELRGHAWGVSQARFSADESKIVTASQDGTVRVWHRTNVDDRATYEQHTDNQQKAPFLGHEGPVFAAALSRDGLSVASGGSDNRVLLWNVADLQAFDHAGLAQHGVATMPKYEELLGHTAPIRSISFTADGRFLVSASDDNTIKVWSARQQTALGRDLVRGELVKTMCGHSGAVADVALAASSPGRLASVSQDGAARYWDIDQYEETRVLKGHTDAVLDANFSPSGLDLVTASRDQSALVWNLQTDRMVHTLKEGHPYLASNAAFFPGNDRLATSGADGTVRVWDLATGVECLTLHGTGTAAAVAVSPSGKWILSSSAAAEQPDGDPVGDKARYANLWDAQTGELATRLGEHRARVTALAFSPDNRIAFSADKNGRGNLWDLQTQRLLATQRWHSRGISAAKFSPGGRTLYTASEDNTVAAWPITFSGREQGASLITEPDLQKTISHPDAVTSLDVFSEDALVTGCSDGAVRLWNVAGPSPQLIWQWQAAAGRAVNSVDVSLENGRVLVVDAESDVHLLDLASGELIDSADETLVTRNLAAEEVVVWSAIFSSDGRQVVTIGGDEARIWNRDGSLAARYGPHRSVASASYAHDGQAVVTAGSDGSARIWDASTGLATLHLGPATAGELGAHEGPLYHAEFSLDDSRVVTAAADGTARIWDASTGKVLRVLPGHSKAVTSASYSNSGRLLVTTSRDGKAAVWSVDDEQTPPIWLVGHTKPVLAAAISPDGSLVATCGEDQTIRLWDAKTGQPRTAPDGRTFPEQTARVNDLAFSLDGSRLVTACGDRLLKVWDTATLREVLTLEGHKREVMSVAFSADGRHMVSGDAFGVTMIWLTGKPGGDH